MRLLLVEDDQKLATNLEKILKRSAYAVDFAATLSEARHKLTSPDYDLLLLDWQLPDGSGLDLCRQLREDSNSLPILMLTANSQLEDKVDGLNAGADDYLTKPFDIAELLARLRALARRLPVVSSPLITIADLTIDTNLKKVTRGPKTIDLSPREYALLEYLALHPCTAISRVDLLSHVWDENANLFSNTVDVHIRYLRHKIDRGHRLKLIVTIKGEGYALCAP